MFSLGDGHVLAVVGANPVGDVRLVRWVDIHVVFSRTGHIEVPVTRFSIHAEVELGVFALSVGIKWVFKVEVARDLVLRGSWVSIQGVHLALFHFHL